MADGDPEWFFKKDDMKASAGGRRVYVARDWQTAQGKTVKQFAALASHDELLRYIQRLYRDGGDACLYELIRFNTPCKLYFDVEWTAALGAGAAGVVAQITDHVDVVLQSVSELARRSPALRRCEVLQSSRADKGREKHSFHLVYPGITVANNTVAMQRITQLVHAHCAALFAQNPVDTSVYTRDRLFRAPLCWKATDATHTALRFADGDHAAARVLSCFVTNVSPPGIWIGGASAAEPVARPLPRARGHPRGRPHGVFLSGRTVDLPKLEQQLQRIIREHGGLGSVRFFRADHAANTLLFRLEHGVCGREEPCLAHGLGSTVTHKSDNQLVAVDANGMVRIICPHKGKCARARCTLCKLEPGFFMSKCAASEPCRLSGGRSP